MADMNSGASNLFTDWYERYVRPRKNLGAEGMFSADTPPDLSPDVTPQTPGRVPGSPILAAKTSLLSNLRPGTPTPVAPAPAPEQAPASPGGIPDPGVMDAAAMGTPTPEPATSSGSWSENLNKGLQDPAKRGLLAAGLSMMATPPRAVPYSTGEIIGNAGLAGIKAFDTALEAKRKDELMKQTAEERTLTREDRRQANLDRAQYYRDSLETRRMTAESLAEARKATAAENAVLDVPIDPAVAKHYGVDPKMTVRTFNKMQSGLTAMAKPEKPARLDPFTEWWNKRIAETGKEPSSKEVAGWHRGPGSGGVDGEDPGKTAAIALINKEMVSQYLPIARDEISGKAAPGSEKMRQMVESLNTQDPTTGGPNEAKVREHLSQEQRKEFDFVKRKAQEYSKTMVPAVAVQKARDDWNAKHPTPKVDTRYEEYRRVYEEIRNYPGWSNAEKNAKIKEMNDKARQMGLIK